MYKKKKLVKSKMIHYTPKNESYQLSYKTCYDNLDEKYIMLVNFYYPNTITIDTINKRFYKSRINVLIIPVFFYHFFKHLSKGLQ